MMLVDLEDARQTAPTEAEETEECRPVGDPGLNGGLFDPVDVPGVSGGAGGRRSATYSAIRGNRTTAPQRTP